MKKSALSKGMRPWVLWAAPMASEFGSLVAALPEHRTTAVPGRSVHIYGRWQFTASSPTTCSRWRRHRTTLLHRDRTRPVNINLVKSLRSAASGGDVNHGCGGRGAKERPEKVKARLCMLGSYGHGQQSRCASASCPQQPVLASICMKLHASFAL